MAELASHYREGDMVWYEPPSAKELPPDCPTFVRLAGEIISANDQTKTALISYLDVRRIPRKTLADLRYVRIRRLPR